MNTLQLGILNYFDPKSFKDKCNHFIKGSFEQIFEELKSLSNDDLCTLSFQLEEGRRVIEKSSTHKEIDIKLEELLLFLDYLNINTPQRKLVNTSIETTVKKIENRIVEIEKLKANWDGEGALKIYHKVILKANWLLYSIYKKEKSVLSFLSPSNINPVSNGTISIDFENNKGGVISISIGKEYSNYFYDIDFKPINENRKLILDPELPFPAELYSDLMDLSPKSENFKLRA